MTTVNLQGTDGSTCTEKHVRNGDDVIDEAENDPDNVSSGAVSNADNFQ